MRRREIWVPVLVVCALGVLTLLLAGREKTAAPQQRATPGPAPQQPLPLQPSPPVALEEQARGFYVRETPALRVVLNLQAGRRFVFTTVLHDGRRRQASGTWSLAGQTLTMVYTRMSGRPEITPEHPVVARNVWTRDRVEILETGTRQHLVLRRQASIRRR
jgi:hypothetical protein